MGDRLVPTRAGNNWQTVLRKSWKRSRSGRRRWSTMMDVDSWTASWPTSCSIAASRTFRPESSASLHTQARWSRRTRLNGSIHFHIWVRPVRNWCGRRRRKWPGNAPPPPFLFKVLATSGLEDYFYLNLVDWSSKNVAAHGLGHFLLHNAAV